MFILIFDELPTCVNETETRGEKRVKSEETNRKFSKCSSETESPESNYQEISQSPPYRLKTRKHRINSVSRKREKSGGGGGLWC